VLVRRKARTTTRSNGRNNRVPCRPNSANPRNRAARCSVPASVLA
jgi:hypothetical protein